MAIFISIMLPFKDQDTPKGLSDEQQAEKIKEFMLAIQRENPDLTCYLTYSANEAQSAAIREYGPTIHENREFESVFTGSNQASVCMALGKKIAEHNTPSIFSACCSCFGADHQPLRAGYLPFTTINYHTKKIEEAHKTGDREVMTQAAMEAGLTNVPDPQMKDSDIEYCKQIARDPHAVILLWRNQYTPDDKLAAIGGGVAKSLLPRNQVEAIGLIVEEYMGCLRGLIGNAQPIKIDLTDTSNIENRLRRNILKPSESTPLIQQHQQ